jgi:hypothetical protein
LVANYQVLDLAGRVLKSGPVDLTDVQSLDSSFSFRIPFTASETQRPVTIAINAKDQDDVQAHTSVTTATALFFDPNAPANSTDAVLASNGSGGDFQGRVRGQVSSFKTPTGVLGLTGRGSLALDGSSDVGRFHAVGQGSAAYRVNSLGAIRASSASKSVIQLKGVASGGLRVNLQGNFRFIRGTNTSLSANAAGRVIPSANGPFGNVQGNGHGSVKLRSNGLGAFAASFSGGLSIKGNVRTQGLPASNAPLQFA